MINSFVYTSSCDEAENQYNGKELKSIIANYESQIIIEDNSDKTSISSNSLNATENWRRKGESQDQ